ncbi:hypothetical protein FB45DRAFT_1052564 [Roridomyces roridus]|uniref:Uncharacterized protein n=1 Tax=Roridomyces roridus TaxID=1738132 RepID=A0AAD7CA45_9AGAR|nr:hypothetical protein FB45DRAFT_1052564 [Roridomyces roridus]
MPEKTPVLGFQREVGWEERQALKDKEVHIEDDITFFGNLVIHKPCTSRGTGANAKYTIASPPPGDARFVEIPGPYGSTDNFINNLNITGRIRAKARGKELAVAICNAVSDHKYVLRVHFKTEAHLFWMPTEMYRRIVSQPTRQRRSGLAFPVPPDCISGPKREDILLTIQAAFFWSALWSSTHGPVHSLEPTATRARFLAWRQSTIANDDDRPILFLMKDKQDIFNGCGAWESVDILVRALVHPAMPASLLCSNETVFHRFITAIMEHEHESTLAMGPGAAQPLPYTSNDSPFWFNREAHKKYVQRYVLCYRRASVSLSHFPPSFKRRR